MSEPKPVQCPACGNKDETLITKLASPLVRSMVTLYCNVCSKEWTIPRAVR